MTSPSDRLPSTRRIGTVLGLLGWSNKRSGVEFYRYDPKIIPRHGSEWGDLLANEDGVAGLEGSPVVVLVLPRSTTDADVRAIELLVRAAVIDKVVVEDECA